MRLPGYASDAEQHAHVGKLLDETRRTFRGCALCVICFCLSAYASTFAKVAFFSINSRRGPTSSPMSMENI